MTVQPTEQWVQIFLRMVAPAVAIDPAAFALRTVASGKAPAAASPPAARPERRRKLRRSSWPWDGPAKAVARVPRRAWRSVRLISMCVPLSARIPVHAIVGLHVIGLPVADLAFFIVGLAVGLGDIGERSRGGGRDTGARAKRPKEIATAHFCFVRHVVSLFHRSLLADPSRRFTTAARTLLFPLP